MKEMKSIDRVKVVVNIQFMGVFVPVNLLTFVFIDDWHEHYPSVFYTVSSIRPLMYAVIFGIMIP